MDSGLYVALSAQVSAERRLATIADNIANANTVGFRQAGIRFAEVVDGPAHSKRSFVSPGVATLSTEQGALDMTGNQMDFAISGDGWFQVQTPDGDAVTRDGRFTVDTEGALVNLSGYPVLDQGGAPVQLNPGSGPLTADASGILFQNNSIVGSLGVFDIGQPDETIRRDALVFIPDEEALPAADRSDFSVAQGFVEKSNVNAIEQITRLIAVQRNFESTAKLIEQSEASLGEAIRLLSGKS